MEAVHRILSLCKRACKRSSVVIRE